MGGHLAQCRDNNTRVSYAPQAPPGTGTGDITGLDLLNRHKVRRRPGRFRGWRRGPAPRARGQRRPGGCSVNTRPISASLAAGASTARPFHWLTQADGAGLS